MEKMPVNIDVNIAPNKMRFYTIDSKESLNNIEYVDNIDSPKKVLFSAETTYGYITDEPIRNLFFQKDVKNLKISVFNESDSILLGKISLIFNEKIIPNDVILPNDFITTNYSIDDLVELGLSVYSEEVKNNYFINMTSPVMVKYHRVEPDKKSTDYILNEYGVKNMVDEKCINLVTKNNTVPQDEDAMYTEWGYQYANFFASVSSLYFEKQFGKGIIPRKDDFIIFLNGGVFMVVTSVTPFYGGNRCITGYNLSLSHNAIDSNVKGMETLEIYADNSEKFFRENGMKDGEDSTNKEFNIPNYIHHDMNRSLLTEDIEIIENEKWNYYSPIKNVGAIEHPVVSYKKPIETNKNFAISLYHKNFDVNNSDDMICRINDFVEFGIASNIPYVTYYGKTSLYSSLSDIDLNKWNIFLLNFNLQEKKIDLIIYDYDSKKRFSQKHNMENIVPFNSGDFNIYATNSFIGQIRVWKNVLPIEFENRILYSKLVEKPSSTFIIDSCDIILNSRTHARPDNMERWKDIVANRGKIN